MNEEQVMDQVDEIAAVTKDVVVPEVFEAVEVVRSNPYILLGVAVAAGSLGGFIGYKVAEKKLKTKFEKLLDEEIEKTKEHYAAFTKTDDFETPEKAAEKLLAEEVEEEIPENVQKLLNKYNGKGFDFSGTNRVTVQEESLTINQDDDEVQSVVHRNIFVDGEALNEDDFDFDESVKNRTPDAPYIITEDEYMENETDYPQRAWTYYSGDDVLADEEDRNIDDAERQVGEENLRRFGHGSRDANIVFIRNDKMGLEYEINRSRGKFSVEVLGLNEPEPRTKMRKFRGDDE